MTGKKFFSARICQYATTWEHGDGARLVLRVHSEMSVDEALSKARENWRRRRPIFILVWDFGAIQLALILVLVLVWLYTWYEMTVTWIGLLRGGCG
jgi:hypothetical protein